jgi:hypothetical protein
MPVIDLPGGKHATLLDPKELTNRHRKLLRRAALPAYKIRGKFDALSKSDDTEPGGDTEPESAAEAGKASPFDVADSEDFDKLSDMQATYILVYLQSWDLDRELPVTVDDVDDIPIPVFDELAKATTKLGMGGVEVDVDDVANPESPTGPSPV